MSGSLDKALVRWGQKAQIVNQSPEGRKSGPTGPSDGDGGDSVLQARVKHLEADMAEMKSDMKAVRADLSEIKGKISMLPGYPGIAVIMSVIGGGLLIASRLFQSLPPQ